METSPWHPAADQLLRDVREALAESSLQCAHFIETEAYESAEAGRPFRVACRSLIDYLSPRVPTLDPPNQLTALAVYTSLMPLLTEAARECGYAIGLHGSMARDLDLIAAPWTEEATGHEELARALCAAVKGRIHGGKTTSEGATELNPSLKPHRRLGWTIHLPTHPHFYIDLSVMPRTLSLFKCTACNQMIPVEHISPGRFHVVINGYTARGQIIKRDCGPCLPA